MPRIAPLKKEQANGKSADMLGAVHKKLGKVPNLLATLAHSPAALGSYLNLSAALDDASIPPALREQIALTAATINRCGYCASAHTVIGKLHGLSEAQTAAALRGEAADPEAQAALDFARAVLDKDGFVDDADLTAVRAAGYTDAQVLDIVATVVFNILTNYMNHVIQTENDFPRVELPQAAGV